jgi:hypothetical protein
LKNDFGLVIGIGRVDHEIVVVGASHDVLCVTGEDDFEFVEDAVVFVGVAETGAEMFVDWDRFDGLPFHVDVPEFDGKVVAGKYVAAIVGETDIGDGRDDF